MKFYIDECYLESITVRKTYYPWSGKSEITEDEFMEALKYTGTIQSISTIDHPEFTKLREHLGNEKYIEIERGWWNGDRVVKPFTFNGGKFKIGDKFPCAPAMKGHLKFTKNS